MGAEMTSATLLRDNQLTTRRKFKVEIDLEDWTNEKDRRKDIEELRNREGGSRFWLRELCDIIRCEE